MVDNEPYRRLDDPANSEFLRSLARGVTPQELWNGGGTDKGVGGIVVGLEDKRGVEYEDNTDRNGEGRLSIRGRGDGAGAGRFQSFSGASQSLGAQTEDLDGGNLPDASVGVVPSSSEAPLATGGTQQSQLENILALTLYNIIYCTSN